MIQGLLNEAIIQPDVSLNRRFEYFVTVEAVGGARLAQLPTLIEAFGHAVRLRMARLGRDGTQTDEGHGTKAMQQPAVEVVAQEDSRRVAREDQCIGGRGETVMLDEHMRAGRDVDEHGGEG